MLKSFAIITLLQVFAAACSEDPKTKTVGTSSPSLSEEYCLGNPEILGCPDFMDSVRKDKAFKLEETGPVNSFEGQVVNLKGDSFDERLKLTIEGQEVPLFKSGDTEAIFITPSFARPGLKNAVLKRLERSQEFKLFILADKTINPASFTDATDLCEGTEFMAADGSIVLGTKSCANVASGKNCSKDGEVGCTTTDSFTATDVNSAASKILAGEIVGGVEGKVGRSAGLAPCSADGEVGCETTGLYKAALVMGAESKILAGQTVAGVSGNVTLPAANKVLTGNSFGVGGTSLAGSLTLPSAQNVLSGSGAYGDSLATVTPTLTLPAVGKVLSGTTYGVAGTGSTGTLILPGAGNVLSTNGNYGDASALTTPTLALPAVGKVLSGTSYGVSGSGSTGTLTLPGAGNVRSNAGAYGDPGSAVTGTIADCAANGSVCYIPAYVLTTQPLKAISYDAIDAGKASMRTSLTLSGIPGTLADCNANAVTGCVTTAGYQSADLTNLAAGNIKRGISLAGTTGNFPSAASPIPRYTDSGATADTGGTDITDLTTFITQLTTDGSFEYWDSTGIRRTGSGDIDITAANVKNAVAFENFSITGSYAGAVAADCTGDGQTGCTTTTRYKSVDTVGTIWPQVVLNTAYQDHITGLVWLRDQDSSFTWQDAIDLCNNSTGGSRSDWRLPTLAELQAAVQNGIWSERETKLSLVNWYYWSTTTFSTSVYVINPNGGHTLLRGDAPYRAVCVAG